MMKFRGGSLRKGFTCTGKSQCRQEKNCMEGTNWSHLVGKGFARPHSGFSLSTGRRAGVRAGDKVLLASCRKIKLNNNMICGPEVAKSLWHGRALGQC